MKNGSGACETSSSSVTIPEEDGEREEDPGKGLVDLAGGEPMEKLTHNMSIGGHTSISQINNPPYQFLGAW